MADPDSSVGVLSDGYELVQGSELMQGDIFEGCPVFRPPADLPWPIDESADEFEFTLGQQDVIVLTQSCDLAPGQKSDMWLVILCPLWRLSEAAAANPFLASSYGKEQCRRGNMTGYHMIAACEDNRWEREVSVVSFREVWSLPLLFVRNMAQAMGPRPRLRSPYREHLAQAFARYFMRVGLPVDIPPYRSERAEEEVMRRLHAMDEETRQRILDGFRE
jgi:hypothetical protein